VADIEFENQAMGTLVAQLRSRHYDKNPRPRFTREERQMIYDNFDGTCCNCNYKIAMDEMDIDHIMPLAEGGDNEYSNLQVLCKMCHKDKTTNEKEDGYVRQSDTASSFNKQTLEIFNSRLASCFAFVEPTYDEKDKVALTRAT
jgi:5-methylcytosine-specific restriction protein A